MKLYNVQNGIVSNNSAVVNQASSNERADKWIRFYKAKFHVFAIPLSIIFSIIHLKFAVEYLGQCTIQPMINIYMIVHASVTLFLVLIALVGVLDARYIYSRSKEDQNKTAAHRLIFIVLILSFVLILFSFAWLVAGSVWVFGAKSNGVQGSDPNVTTTYCQSELYRAAFVLIIVNYILHLLTISMFIFKLIRGKRERPVPPLAAAADRV